MVIQFWEKAYANVPLFNLKRFYFISLRNLLLDTSFVVMALFGKTFLLYHTWSIVVIPEIT